MLSGEYVDSFYSRYATGSERSGAVVADLLTPILKPHSILDVGCGNGGWLARFREHGAETVHGVDGPWAPAPANLGVKHFTAVEFETQDLSRVKLPQDRYDLVMSMEFLEHVSDRNADALVDFLVSHGDVLLISAAIPLQGGEHHVNERWPEYWGEKFAARGFVAFDAVRLALWDRSEVESWYRQNLILYFKGEVPEGVRKWGEKLALAALSRPRALVHPEFYAKRLGRITMALSKPLAFLKLLRRERRTSERVIPSFGNLGRHS
jgi:SAM-dependent methyltransferase